VELRQLKTLRVVATTLNFTRSAAVLDYTQSSVTAHIQGLEEELGCPLFDRLGKKVVLTDAGRRLVTYAEQILDLVDEAREAVTREEEPSGTLTICAPGRLAFRARRKLSSCALSSFLPACRLIITVIVSPVPSRTDRKIASAGSRWYGRSGRRTTCRDQRSNRPSAAHSRDRSSPAVETIIGFHSCETAGHLASVL